MSEHSRKGSEMGISERLISVFTRGFGRKDYKEYEENVEELQASDDKVEDDLKNEEGELFADSVNHWDPNKVFILLKGFLIDAKGVARQDVESFENIIKKANHDLKYDNDPDVNNIVQFISYKIILVALHRYVVNIEGFKKNKQFIDTSFKAIYVFSTLWFVNSNLQNLGFADYKVREMYHNITYYIVKFFFRVEYGDDEVKHIVDNIVADYERICHQNREEGKEVRESMVLAKCILDCFFQEYEKKYFDIPIEYTREKEESFEASILGLVDDGGKIIQFSQEEASRIADIKRSLPNSEN